MIDATFPARICCVDLDTFFVSVERLLEPMLRGKPVVVGATPGMRGVVTCASYEVRALGVRSGMAIAEAVRLAPGAIYLPTRHGVYSTYAGQVRAVLERYTPIVQTASIDEFFLDFRGCENLYRSARDSEADAVIERTVREMRQQIQSEVGLPASAGIGATRAIGKIASGLAKPAGVRMVRVGEEAAFLSPLAVRKFPGIGPKTEGRLLARGIQTLGQLVAQPRSGAFARFAPLADAVHRQMWGETRSELGADRPAFLEHDPDGVTLGSISNERTFREDVGNRNMVERQLLALVERVCWRARRRQVRARTVTLKLRYSDFDTLTRSRTMHATNCDAAVFEGILELYRVARTRPLSIRLVGVQLSNLVGPERQLSLAFDPRERGSVGGAIDAVRSKFGFDFIRIGATGRGSGWLEGFGAEPRGREAQSRTPQVHRDRGLPEAAARLLG